MCDAQNDVERLPLADTTENQITWIWLCREVIFDNFSIENSIANFDWFDVTLHHALICMICNRSTVFAINPLNVIDFHVITSYLLYVKDEDASMFSNSFASAHLKNNA